MGQTRVDLLHLLEDLRDAYPGDLEETILTEIVANSLDSGARHLRVLTEPADRTLVVVDDGRGMGRRELSRYHDIAASTKQRGEGIGFAGVGIKLGLLVAEEVLTETRRGASHVATRWRLASHQRAPWNWAPPPGWVSEKGTAVGLRLKNPLSPLLDAGYVEAALRRNFEPLLDAAFDVVLAEYYPEGLAFVVNGRGLAKRAGGGDRAPVEVRLPRKRKAAALGYVERFPEPIHEDRQGIAISTLGKVIRRGWDWLGVTCTSPSLVAGLVEAPGLAAVLTLNKGDFVRAGRRGITYLAYRKAIQEVTTRQLDAWGEGRDREDTARRRAAKPLEKDLETVLVDLSEDYPALSALVERRAGGQRRLPTGRGAAGFEEQGSNRVASAPLPSDSVPKTEADSPFPNPEGVEPSEAPDRPAANSGEAAAKEPLPPTVDPPVSPHGPKRPSRYGLAIDFEEQPDHAQLGRLVESTVWVNTAHPAYARAVASRAEGYHVALTVGLSLAPLAAEPGKSQEFLTEFLARWGESLGRDRRRRRARR
jgi:Histidine kinase-, DNA gyrase B-, and HSP90-like ATPase